MKHVLLVGVCVFLFIYGNENLEAQTKNVTYKTFGKNMKATGSSKATIMASKYKTMKVGNILNTKMTAKVKSVCQSKGCWMRLDLEDGNEVMVKFKDYGFFMPKDIAGKYVIINGKAFVEEMSVDEQRHYAEDAGKSKTEIASITKPKRTYSFEADGVLVKQ